MSRKNLQPPQWAKNFLHWYCPDNLLEEIEGDLVEEFIFNRERNGPELAARQYAWDVIRFCNPTTFKKSRSLREGRSTAQVQSFFMWKNYSRSAIRHMWREKGSTLINVIGLSVGVAATILIFLFIADENKFDIHHENASSIYRIITERGGDGQGGSWASTSPAMGPTLVESFPEIEKSLRVFRIRQDRLFKREQQSHLESQGIFAEPSIFQFFALPLRFGDPETALSTPDALVISSALSRKYFGSSNPVGEIITVGKDEMIVSGVLGETSSRFHLDFNFICSFEYLRSQTSPERMQSWVWQDFFNYIQVNQPFHSKPFQSKLDHLIEQRAHPQTEPRGFHYYASLQPLVDIHLHSAHLQNDMAVRGNYRYVQALRWIALFLLVIALINFINLSTATAGKRAKEVGMRKVSGASQGQLVGQYICEATILAGISILFACLLAFICLPELNHLSGKDLFFPIFGDLRWSMGLALSTLVLGVAAGFYPGVVIARQSNMTLLTSGGAPSPSVGNRLRQGLVTLQFAISILLIICVCFVYRQLNYLQNGDLGFGRDQLIHAPMKGAMYQDFDEVRNRFGKIPGVQSVSVCFGIPGDIVAGDDITVSGENAKTYPARIFNVDHAYVKTMGMEIIAGRDFSAEHPTDALHGFILNETAVRKLGIAENANEAIGQELEWPMWEDFDTTKYGTVIGVVKDFHYQSLHEQIETSVLQVYPNAFWKVVMRIQPSDVEGTLTNIKDIWSSFETGYPFDYQFVDESFSEMYVAEGRLARLLRLFAGLAIFVACIGALGLSVAASERRRSEIGIRKVLGATLGGITLMLVREFVMLLVIAFVAAAPLAYLISHNWLQDFVYRIQLDWWVFLAAFMVTMGLALTTVGYQSVRAALANPIDAIQDD